MRIAGIIYGLILAGWAGLASAAAPLTPAEMTVCKSVKHCVDIVERHNSGAYDYSVLHGEFLRFGDKGKAALLSMLSGKDKADMRRAQILLAKGRFRFSPDEQRTIAALWPRGDLEAHAAVMRRSLSPLMRARMIDTLSHEDDSVRKISREIIAATIAMKMDFPLKPSDYGKLSRAAISEPTPALVELLASFDAAKTAPIFTRLLKSGDGPSTISAYQKLYEQNQKTAFETLLGTLYDLKESDAEAAFALAAMLRERHKTREDGFYLKFAKDIAEDPEMSAMGRLAGLDAVMTQYGGQNFDAIPILADTPLILSTFRRAVEAHDVFPRHYIAAAFKAGADNPDPWIKIIWDKIKIDPYANPYMAREFFDHIGAIDTILTKKIVGEALAGRRDFGLINLGMQAAVMQGDKSRIPQLQKFLSHPINDVKAMAELAIESLSHDAENIGYKEVNVKIKEFNKSSKTCKTKATDFREDVKRLPFFDLGVNPVTLSGTKRKVVSTIMPTHEGWLVGYNAGEWGGGLEYYENQSGEGINLLDTQTVKSELLQNVTAILPVRPPALGRYSTEFWAFIFNGGFDNQAAVFRISKTKKGFNMTRHAQLPNRDMAITQLESGDVFIGFGKYDNSASHPPLLLSPNGAIGLACKAPVVTTEALP